MKFEQTAAMLAEAQQRVDNGEQAPEDMRCQHPGKHCAKVRTIKLGGGMHRLCADHRERANKNQWRVDQRRRLRRASSSLASEPNRPQPMSAQPALEVVERAVGTRPPLSEEDLQYLEELLFDEQDGDGSDENTTMDISI